MAGHAELLSFLMGKLDDKALIQVLDRIFEYKADRANSAAIPGIDMNSMTVDTPIPFSLKKLWFELLEPEIKTRDNKERTLPALIDGGDANSLKPPRYKPHSTTNTPPFLNTVGVMGIRRQLDQMRSRLLDRQYEFLLHPGSWEPDLNGDADKDLPDLLATWLGHDKPITILDTVLIRLIGAILRIIYEGLFWGREKSEGGIQRPMLVVMEEAHRYLSKDTEGLARIMVQRIVKEGRKFGIGAMIISQRPSEVDDTILSQCGTFVALRLSNDTDRNRVKAALPDSLAGVIDTLPVLRTGEAIVTGEAARLPIRCRIALPSEEHRPYSEDPEVAKNWQTNRISEDYQRVAASWRSQNARWSAIRLERTHLDQQDIEQMEREFVSSSTIVAVGYDPATETLEMEFKHGGIYQYYNVPNSIHQQLMESSSKGQFFHTYIRNSFPYSRV